VVVIAMELRERRGRALGCHQHDLLHVETSTESRPARVTLVVVVDTRAEVKIVAVVERRPQ